MVLTAGGETDSCSGNWCSFAGSVASAELYDPTAGTFVATGSMTTPRETHTATVLGDGRVLLAGGALYGSGAFGGSLASGELYTPDVLVRAPALVSVSGDGHGQGSIFHTPGTTHVAAGEDPAIAGEILDIYCTGMAIDKRDSSTGGHRWAFSRSPDGEPGARRSPSEPGARSCPNWH